MALIPVTKTGNRVRIMSLLPEQMDRYRKFFGLIIKYWHSDLVEYSSQRVLGESELKKVEDYDPSPEELAEDLKKMGPAYIKLGQLLSTRPDLLPVQYLRKLRDLQDNVAPIDSKEVVTIFEEEVGVKISKAFKEFDPKPLASASLGQVHSAILHSGKEVAVKIQRPGVREQLLADLDTLKSIAEYAVNLSKEARKFNIDNLIEEIRFTLIRELDYENEARSLLTLKKNMTKFRHLYIPKPFLDYSTSKVLTMEYVFGKKVTKISPYKRMEEDLSPLVEDLVEGYLKQIVEDGFAHADPHPGNIHITPDNKLAILDLGMTVRFSGELQDHILQLMIGLSNYDSGQISDSLLKMSEYDSDTANIEEFKKRISHLVLETQNKTAEDMQTGRLIIQMNRVAAYNGIQIPVEITMLAKILLNLDQIVAVLSPTYKVNDTIQRYVHKIMASRMVHELKPSNLFTVLLQSKELAEKMPERFNRILENLSRNQFEIKVNAIDQSRFTDAFQKVANRITAGIIIAAMIIGAALLIQIPTSWTIFGYPGLAIILFTIAAMMGFYLLFTIIVNDDNLVKKK